MQNSDILQLLFTISVHICNEGGDNVRYIVCYDISEQKIRTKVVKYLESFALRIQYSVFTFTSSGSDIKHIFDKLESLTSGADSPSLVIFPMCKSCEEKTMMIGKPMEQEMEVIIA